MENLIEINNIRVDVEGIYSIDHLCPDETCDIKNCCCASYEICVEKEEFLTINKYLDGAAGFAGNLKTDGEYENVFEKVERKLYSIDSKDDESCVFAYITDKKMLCSLHSTALNLDILPHKIKPKVCSLWPLSMTEDSPTILSVDDDAFLFSCNKKRKNRENSLSLSISKIIENSFGVDFLEKLCSQAQL